ncbi:MAG: ribosomal protection-like ABC-F family protein [Cyclobacteriaceae bacterium]
MIAINNLSYFIGGRALYENASLHIKPQDKIGLIGLNGTGKTTLLRLINGEYTADGGEINKSNDCTIGYLNQDLLSFESRESILTVAMQAFEKQLKMQDEIDAIIQKMEQEYSDDLVNKLSHLQEQFEALEGYTIQSKAEEVLEGIGFNTEDLKRPLHEFSGGWRMRVMLAKLLLEKPSLLMLDEPTNHLDLPSIQWVEGYLRNYEGAVIIVSHDKTFINNCSSKIVEVEGRNLVEYEGNYDFYLEEKALRSEIQQNAFENQQQKIKQAEQFINRFRAKATKARQVQSRIKALERMDKVDEVVDNNVSVNFKFSLRQQSGRYIVNLEHLNKSYPEIEIFDNASAGIERGDKIALIGANGKGKSTLLRIIAGTETFEGERKWGYNVDVAFYAQHQLEALHLNNEILEELKQAGSNKSEQELRNVLGSFLFTGDDVFKKIKVLSGGEKSRIALAKTLISEANFLILDEPTNHLDIQSVNILIQALQQYEGSYIIVSHDRYFISQTANKIWYIEDKDVKEYPGTYDEFVYWTDKKQPNISSKEDENKQEKKPKKPTRDEAEYKEIKNQRKKLEKELESVEEQIMKLEEKKKQLEAELALPEVYADVDKMLEVNQAYEKVKQEIADTQQVWDKMAIEFDQFPE